MKYQLKVYSIWEFGQRKDSQGNPHQEDSLFPEFGKQSDSDRLFILCDGMGGHDAGEVASATVCEAMSQSILNDGHDKDGVFTIEDFDAAMDAAFKALDERDSGAEKKMGTTMTFLKLYNEGAFIAHMGDSRVYHIRPGKNGDETKILYETPDHSLVNDLIKIGELTKEEARNSKQKNVITRAMQPHMDRKPKAEIYQTKDIKPGDYFYMCSDGMLEQPDMEDGSSIRNIFSDMGGDDDKKVDILTSVTEKNRDNHTAFIIHITDVIDHVEEKTETTKTAAPVNAEPDKFTAIVEEDESKTEETHNEASLPVTSNNNELAKKEPFIQNHRKIRKKIVRWIVIFAITAFAVFALFLTVGIFKTCSSDKDTDLDDIVKEKIDKDHDEDDDDGKKPIKKKKTEAQSAADENAAIEVANSEATESLTSGANAPQPSEQQQPAPANPAAAPTPSKMPKPATDSKVVNSDTQKLQNTFHK